MSSGPGRSSNSRAISLPTLMRSFTKMTTKGVKGVFDHQKTEMTLDLEMDHGMPWIGNTAPASGQELPSQHIYTLNMPPVLLGTRFETLSMC